MSTVDLRLGDCLELMRDIPDGSVDAVITDFPYGNGTDYGSTYADTQEHLIALIADAMPPIRRIARRALVFSGVGAMYLYPEPSWILCWTWTNTSSTGKWGFNNWQPILCYGSDPQLSANRGRYQDAKMFRPNDNDGIGKIEHPCPKPITVMQWVVERCTLPGETILDPFMGSGTSGVACVKLGRNFIGMEINPDYFAIAQRRIAETQAQLGFDSVMTDNATQYEQGALFGVEKRAAKRSETRVKRA